MDSTDRFDAPHAKYGQRVNHRDTHPGLAIGEPKLALMPVEVDDYERPRRITDRFGVVYECVRKLEQPRQGPGMPFKWSDAPGTTQTAAPNPPDDHPKPFPKGYDEIMSTLGTITNMVCGNGKLADAGERAILSEVRDLARQLAAAGEIADKAADKEQTEIMDALRDLQSKVTPAYVPPRSFTLEQQAAKWAYEQAAYQGRNGHMNLSGHQVYELAQRLYRFAMNPETHPLHKDGDPKK